LARQHEQGHLFITAEELLFILAYENADLDENVEHCVIIEYRGVSLLIVFFEGFGVEFLSFARHFGGLGSIFCVVFDEFSGLAWLLVIAALCVRF
jgi:hypothetical protein